MVMQYFNGTVKLVLSKAGPGSFEYSGIPKLRRVNVIHRFVVDSSPRNIPDHAPAPNFSQAQKVCHQYHSRS